MREEPQARAGRADNAAASVVGRSSVYRTTSARLKRP